MSIWPFEGLLEGTYCAGPTVDDILRRGLSLCQNAGRLPVDVYAVFSRRLPAEIRGSATLPADNPLVPRKNPLPVGNYAFSPTGNSASLKGTPHPPIPQYPFGFFARYCWWYSSA